MRSEPPPPGWDALRFGLTPTDRIFRARGGPDGFDEGELLPFGEIGFSPAAAVFSYGLGVFEGLKAHRGPDGRILLFRPEQNAARFGRSAEQLLLPPLPEGRFLRAVEQVVAANQRFVPPPGKGALYLRPMELATEPRLGHGPCQEVCVLIYCSPVGPYFGGEGLRLRVVRQARVAPEGVGSAKAIGNYAGCLRTVQLWRARGYSDVVFLDACKLQHVTETSGSNVFARLRDGRVVTPPLDDQILAGVTRDSVIHLLQVLMGIPVEERPLSVDELMLEAEEVFCTGTAYTVQGVVELHDDERQRRFASVATACALREALLEIQLGQKLDRLGWTRPVAT